MPQTVVQLLGGSPTSQLPKPGKSQKKKRVKITGGCFHLTIKALDNDGDGQVSLSEFVAAGGTEEQFVALDADGSGQVDEAELQEAREAAAAEEGAAAAGHAAGIYEMPSVECELETEVKTTFVAPSAKWAVGPVKSPKLGDFSSGKVLSFFDDVAGEVDMKALATAPVSWPTNIVTAQTADYCHYCNQSCILSK